MLQFLQYKTFGRHKVPDGWIVVTAGNPPEYNNSVHDFNIVTWDRLKRIDVEPDFEVWREYAVNAGVHPAILTFLEIKTAYFYKIESTVDGKSFVTARGWEDLSRMIRLYEQNHIEVDRLLTGQYIQNEKIAREFAQYYDLFNKYRSDYQVDAILAATAVNSIQKRAAAAKFDERLSLIGLLLDKVHLSARDTMDGRAVLTALMVELRAFQAKLTVSKEPSALYSARLEAQRKKYQDGKKSGSQSQSEQRALRRLIGVMEEELQLLTVVKDSAEAFSLLKQDFENRVSALRDKSTETSAMLANLYKFAEEAWGDGQEMLIITTELTANRASAEFISKFRCEAYFRHNKDLLLYERQDEIKQALEELDLN